MALVILGKEFLMESLIHSAASTFATISTSSVSKATISSLSFLNVKVHYKRHGSGMNDG